MTHRERQQLIRRAFPSCAVLTPGKSWAGAYIRPTTIADSRARWVALEDEERLRELLTSEQAEALIDE